MASMVRMQMFNVDMDKVDECSFSFNTICNSDWPELWRLTTLCAPLGKSGLISPENASYGWKRERRKSVARTCPASAHPMCSFPSAWHQPSLRSVRQRFFGGGSFLPCRGRTLQHLELFLDLFLEIADVNPRKERTTVHGTLTQHSNLFDV